MSLRFFNKKMICFKGALSGLRQFLAVESPLKMMKNAFYFTSKVLFVLKIYKFSVFLFFFRTNLWNIFGVFVIYLLFDEGTNWKRWLGDLFLIILNKQWSFLYQRLYWRDSKPNSWCFFWSFSYYGRNC